jgi:two-component system, NtrC family, sensor kinase
MKKTQKLILMVDESEVRIEQMKKAVEKSPKRIRLEIKRNLSEARSYAAEFKPDLVIAYLNLPGGKGTELLNSNLEEQEYPLIVTGGVGSEYMAVDVIKAGALDFVIATEAAMMAMPRIIERVLREWNHITKRRQAERKKNQAEKQYRTLFEESKDVVFICKMDGVFTDINRAGVELFGYGSKTEFLSIDVARHLYIDDRNRKQFLAEIKERKYVKDYQLELKKKNDDRVVVLVTAVSIRDEKNNPSTFTGMMRDITQKIENEKKLLGINAKLMDANRKLKQFQASLIHQEKLASIGQLAAGVAHELNNPLGFVSSNFKSLKKYIEIIKKYVAIIENDFNSPELNSKKFHQFRREQKIDFILQDIEDLLEESSEGFERMTNIVENLRFFSRVDFENKVSEYDLNKGINSTLTVARNEIKYVAIVETDLGELPLIECKGDEINQVLLNIIVNAAQAIKSQDREQPGTIKIRTSTENGFVYCEISDDGPGITAEVIDKIFDPFFTTKDVGQGTGLGLNISHDIVINKHKGNLTVESEPENGCKFIVKLPVRSIARDRDTDDMEN